MKRSKTLFGSRDPKPLMKDWIIPWIANTVIWATTVSVIGLWHSIHNPVLLYSPLPKTEKDFLIDLVDYKTVLVPLGISAILVLVAIFLWIYRRHGAPEGRNTLIYLAWQFLDEIESFALNAASISLIVAYYTHNWELLKIAVGGWLIWSTLHWHGLNRMPIP